MIFTAMAGAKELQLAQQSHMNNLSNASSYGYRADFSQQRAMPVFGDVLASRVYAMTEQPQTRWTPGSLMTTGRDLDVAVRDEGWMVIADPAGQEALTRTASMHTTAARRLVTELGYPVQGNNGSIALPPFDKMEIGVDGTISIIPGGENPDIMVTVDRIKLVNPPNEVLRKGEDGLVRRIDGGVSVPDARMRMVSGVLEKSNVNPVEELLGILDAARRYELQVKMMGTAQEIASEGNRLLEIA